MNTKIKSLLALSLISIAAGIYADIVDVYDFKMSLRIPRTVDNMQSLGYRKYQTQTLRGYLYVTYDDEDNVTLEVKDLVNKTHKINGNCITYDVTVDNEGERQYPIWTYIGNNKTGKFYTPSVCFYMDCDPSYNIGDDEPDNSLLITLSGTGSTCDKGYYTYSCNGKKQLAFKYRLLKSLNGRVVGTLGCGCRAYGHTSPTRKIGAFGAICDYVVDIAAVDGTWRAVYNSKLSKGR